MATMNYSPAGLAMTESFEGLQLKAYPDSAGVWTIGYGHTGPDVLEGKIITDDEAAALLASDLQVAEDCVNELFSAVTLTQGQFDACVDFCFNVGRRNFAKSSIASLILAGTPAAAASHFGLWVYAGGKPVDGLIRRRAAEAAMFRGVAA